MGRRSARPSSPCDRERRKECGIDWSCASCATTSSFLIPRTMTNVMLVEDEDDAREVLATALEEAGYKILRADNGAVAWRLLQEHQGRCDLILLDLMMPTMSGWDFRRKQREDTRFSQIPVLLMSAGAHIATVASELGAAGYVSKPVEIPELLQSIRKHSS